MRKLVIVGFGLIGGSIALGVRKHALYDRIIAVDHPEVFDQVRQRAAADDFIRIDDEAKMAGLFESAALTVLSAPVNAIMGWLSHALEGGGVVTDCGSTKRAIIERASRSPRRACFVPGHPMAGDPTGGLAAARPDLFHERTWIVCPADVDTRCLNQTERLVRGLGGRVVHMEAEQHDRAVAVTSHLPQLIASQLLSLCSQAEAMDAAGPAFVAATRVAGGPVSVWRDILQTNSDEIAEALGRLCADLSRVMNGLRTSPPDVDAALELLALARRLREKR